MTDYDLNKINDYITQHIAPKITLIYEHPNPKVRQECVAILPLIATPYYYWEKEQQGGTGWKEEAQRQGTYGQQAPPQPPPQPQTLMTWLPAEAQGKISIYITGEGIYTVMPTSRLGSPLFHKVSDMLRPFGFKYISAGNASRWELPK